MKQLKKVTDLLFVKFIHQGKSKQDSQNMVLTILKEYQDLLEKTQFNQVASEIKFTWL